MISHLEKAYRYIRRFHPFTHRLLVYTFKHLIPICLAVFIGIYTFNYEQKEVLKYEHKKKVDERELEAYVSLGRAVGGILVHSQDTIIPHNNIEEFMKIYYGDIALLTNSSNTVSDTTLGYYIEQFRVAIDEYYYYKSINSTRLEISGMALEKALTETLKNNK